MFISIDLKRLSRYTALFIVVFSLFSFAMQFPIQTAKVAKMSEEHFPTLVIDAGHGGVDGGAISTDGVKESDINLAIALKYEAVANFLGIKTVMTRTEDEDNSENGNYSEHDNLVKRVELANSIPNAVLISIHQNKFPSAAVRGAEVMYSDNEKSKILGVITQGNLVAHLDRDNRRVSRPAPKELLLTAKAKCPTVLVECGYMSNPEEVKKLQDEAYQTKLSVVLLASFIQYTNNLASI